MLLVGDVFANAARAVPDRVAVVLRDDALTFAELDRGGNHAARALAAVGIGVRDRVAVWSGTDVLLAPLFAGLAELGAVFAPVSGVVGADEATAMATAAQPSLLVVDEAHADDGRAVAARLGVEVVTLAALTGPAAPGDDADVDARAAGLTEHDAHVVFFTSGSTGRPKGVVLSHRVNVLRTHPGAQLEPRGALVCPYPLFHMGAWTLALQQWQARDLVVFLPSADAAGICDAVVRHRAARLNAIPGVWRRVLDHLDGATLPSLRFADTGTSATPPDLLEAIGRAAPNATVRVFYGSTEAGNVAALDHEDFARKPGSVGTPSPFTTARIADDGELLVRGPLLFDGYFADPEATADAFVDGWFRTGDLGEVDGDGFLTIVGRAKDVIRTGGETVAPAEVEAALADHPAVADLAVVGLPDARWGEVVCAVVVAVDGAPAPTVEDLQAHAAERLARFKLPRRVAVVDAIPRTASTGQVQRRLLVEQLVS